MRRIGVAAMLATQVALSSCSGPHVAALPTATPIGTGPARYEIAIDAAAARGLKVWVEVDLAKRWLAGRSSFDQAVQRLGELARRPGVVGFKIADELGYDEPFKDDPSRMRRFLDDSARALRAVAPGRSILIDMVVPELGCAPGIPGLESQSRACIRSARAKYPALRLESIDSILASGDVDVLDLSTFLLSSATYRNWGTTDDVAQLAAWHEAERRGWQRHVRLQGRKALAHPGSYAGTQIDAEHDAVLFIDEPRASGAGAIDIWTWRQLYQGQVVRLMDPGNRSNALWQALVARRATGAVLFTHFTPSSLEVGLTSDLDQLATVFSDVFMAGGLG